MSPSSPNVSRPLRPLASSRPRPWAGTRLGPPAGTGERWLAAPELVVPNGSGVLTLEEIAATAGAAFVGANAIALLGPRFPLIVKLIDAGDWLSLQVHPDDDLARELYGPDAVGKSEAWLVLDAEDDTRLITGPRRGLDPAVLRDRIAGGRIGHAECEDRAAVPGDVLLLGAGTLHAIGAGAFVYEIEQPSDLTFRVSDWGRPSVPGRHLHTAESLRAVRPDAHAIPSGAGWRVDGDVLRVREFQLEVAALDAPAERRPDGRTLEVVTALEQGCTLVGDGWTEALDPLETAIVPAAIPAYRIEGAPGAHACVGSIPAATAR